MWENENGRVGVEWYYTGRQRLEDNSYRGTSESYNIIGLLIERRVGPLRLFVNGENLTDTSQEAHAMPSGRSPVKGGRLIYTLTAQPPPVDQLSARPPVAPSSHGSVVDGNAQQSTTKGWVFGFDLGGAAVSVENKPSDGAGLVGARVGYGLNRILTVYLSAYEADVDVLARIIRKGSDFGSQDGVIVSRTKDRTLPLSSAGHVGRKIGRMARCERPAGQLRRGRSREAR